MVGGPTDAELVAAWQRGDAEAGTRLFDRHVQRLYRFFTSKAQVDPDDLVQRTFLNVVEGAARIRDGRSFRAYLFTIARRLLFAHYQERHKVPVTTLSNKPLVELGPSPTSVARRGERKRVILAALAQLPLDTQIALELHYWEQFEVQEIAEVVDAPLGTIKSRIRRGKQRLREILEDDPAGSFG